jgi:hypothetical protein
LDFLADFAADFAAFPTVFPVRIVRAAARFLILRMSLSENRLPLFRGMRRDASRRINNDYAMDEAVA